MTCACRHHAHPRAIDIAPGLTRLPRLSASYGEFRRAMLSDASSRPVFDDWSAREQGDLGVLLIEMWAAACEIVAFADESFCHECYFRTARQATSLRRLIALLGYRPRPAIAATAEVSFSVDGRRHVTLPRGLALRSGAVGEHPPQVFELLEETVAHPLSNTFTVRPGSETAVAETSPGSGLAVFGDVTVVVEGPGLGAGALVRVATGAATSVHRVVKAVALRGRGPQRKRLSLDPALTVVAGTPWDDLRIETASRRVGLWTLDVTGFTQPGLSTSGGVTTLTLDGLHRQFRSAEPVVVERGTRARWFVIDRVEETSYRLSADVAYSFDDDDYTLPGASALVTRLVLDDSINDAGHRTSDDTATWDDSHAPGITVHGGWVLAGTFETPTATELASGAGPLDVGDDVDTPWNEHTPHRFTIVDRDGRAVTAAGSIDWSSGDIQIEDVAWDPPLRHPITVEGNVATATRGETVVGEVLGTGDASRINQVFSLANSPLTYLGPAASGSPAVAASTLVVWVDAVRWREVPHFVGTGPADRVYVVRHLDDGTTDVVFGDGVRGARLPTGTDNVVADYRYGAGAIHPESGSIAQLVRPVPGLSGVVNRSAAFGGADAASADDLRTDAPRSALLLGRIVSRADAAAAARETPGVIAATADLAWNPDRLESGIVVRYIGDPSLAAGLRSRLRSLAECDIRIDAVVSSAMPVALSVVAVTLADRRPDDVREAVVAALSDEGGALTPAVLGIDGPLFRSRLMAAVAGVDGVGAVISALVDGHPFDEFAVAPPEGWHLDAISGLDVVVEEP